MRFSLSVVTVCLAGFSGLAQVEAATLYVDNHLGSDRNDGVTPEVVDVRTGPVRSISRALNLAKPSDTIVITNTGKPYYDNITLSGERLSGSQLGPLRII